MSAAARSPGDRRSPSFSPVVTGEKGTARVAEIILLLSTVKCGIDESKTMIGVVLVASHVVKNSILFFGIGWFIF